MLFAREDFVVNRHNFFLKMTDDDPELQKDPRVQTLCSGDSGPERVYGSYSYLQV